MRQQTQSTRNNNIVQQVQNLQKWSAEISVWFVSRRSAAITWQVAVCDRIAGSRIQAQWTSDWKLRLFSGASFVVRGFSLFTHSLSSCAAFDIYRHCASFGWVRVVAIWFENML